MRTHQRSVGFSVLAASIALLAACSSKPPPRDLAAQLEADTGVPWTVYTDPRSQEVRFLAPKTPVSIGSGSPEDNARAFFQRYRDALHASGSSDELVLTGAAADSRGGIHIRFSHFLPGTTLPVFGAGSTAHFTAQGAVYWLETDFRADLAELDGAASITRDAAAKTALAHAQAACGASSTAKIAASDLGVLSDPDTHAALAYRVAVTVQDGSCLQPSVFVDAKSGAPLKIEEGASSIDPPSVGGSRYYRLKDLRDVKPISVTNAPGSTSLFRMSSDDERGTRVITHSFSTGAVIQTNDVTHWDESSTGPGAADDAHYFSRNALAFLRAFPADFADHGKANLTYPLSLDVDAFVHENTEANSNGFNAYAVVDPVTHGDTIHFGDGNPAQATNALPFSAAYDVVAHELTHLITAHTSNLKYERESGALNESFSDVMGAAAEHAGAADDAKNFLIGEDLFIHELPGMSALRSMTAPRNFGDPDHTDALIPCPASGPTADNDECDVHRNSGIPNRAFSLIVQGGSVSTFENGQVTGTRPVGVATGIGWEKATELTYWATTGLTATATFQNAAYAQIAEAARLVDDDPTVVQEVTCAWTAVGVLGGSPEFLQLLGSTVCTPSTPPAPAPKQAINLCEGYGDALVCDTVVQLDSAVHCKDGAPVPNSTELCADQNTRCQTVSSSDATARVENGVIVCQ